MVDGTEGGGAGIPGSAAKGLYTDPHLSVVRIQVTPTVSTTPAYTAKDCVGGLMTFANAARISGGAININAVQIVDKSQQQIAMDLVLLDRTMTATTDNAIFAPTDAEMAFIVGVIPFVAGDYKDFSTNSVATLKDINLTAVLNGTSLFGQLVTRGTPTYVATTDIVVTVTLTQL